MDTVRAATPFEFWSTEGTAFVRVAPFQGERDYVDALRSLSRRLADDGAPPVLVLCYGPGAARAFPAAVLLEAMDAWLEFLGSTRDTVRIASGVGGRDVFAGTAFAHHLVLMEEGASVCAEALDMPGLRPLLRRRSDRSFRTDGEDLSAWELSAAALVDVVHPAGCADAAVRAAVRAVMRRHVGEAGIYRAISMLRQVPGGADAAHAAAWAGRVGSAHHA